MKNKIIFLIFLTITNFTMMGQYSPITSPTNFVVNRNTDTANSITFSWDPSANVKSYNIYWQRKTDGSSIPFNTNSPSYGTKNTLTNNIILTGNDLVLPMNYYLYVVAVYFNGTSQPSNVVLYDSSPNVPTYLTVNQINSSTVNLSWDPSPDSEEVIGYFVYDNDFALNFITATANPSISITNLVPGSTHSFAVESLDQYMNSSFSTLNSISYCVPTGGVTNPISNITNVSIGAGFYNSTYNDTFYNNFSQIYFVEDFEIYKNSSKNTIAVTIAAPDFAVGTGKDTDLNTIVYAYIDYNHDGLFTLSELITFGNLSVKSRSINVPITFLSDSFTPNSAASTGLTTMRIVLQRNGLQYPPNSSCTVNGFGEVEDYSIYIGAGWNKMIGPLPAKPTNKATITLDNGKDLVNINDDSVIKLYPNPVSGDYMNITAVADKTPYKIINLLGQEVASGKIDNGLIAVTKLIAGTYVLEFENNNERVVKRFIKK